MTTPHDSSVTDDSHSVIIDGGPLTIEQVGAVARGGATVRLGPQALERLEASNRTLGQAIAGGGAIYGVNTGFGSLARKRIADDALPTLQRNLLRSHAAGVGAPLPVETVRAMMLLLLGSLCRGRSGVRPVVAQAIAGLLNANLTPIVPESGSVGASGDLAPLAHACLALLGEGAVVTKGGRHRPASDALREAGITPIELHAKEGLALINGTHLMAAQGALLMEDADRVLDAATLGTAMSIDACRATDSFLDERVYHARNQQGPALIAWRLRQMLRGSTIVTSHRVDDPRVQDPYSLRCSPYVLGAAMDMLNHVRGIIDDELGAVTDNPLVFAPEHAGEQRTSDPRDDGDRPPLIVSAGNFHGMPIALPLDTVPIALAHIAGIAERRVFFMLAASDPEAHLHAHLSPNPGLQSGLMITQYTAAALCNELITLSTPASVSNITTCAGMEDYNSFGPRAAAKARRALELARQVVAIELLCAAEAIEYHRPLRSGDLVERGHAAIREAVPDLTEDRSPTPDIEAIVRLIEAGAFALNHAG
ncbi:MAG: histidine ammonia-lyase [Phycisphaerales bacterium]